LNALAIDIPRPYVLVAVGTLALGLAVDVRTSIVGQMMLSALVWMVLLALLVRLPAATRYPLMACMTLATVGELVLSLGWGLYTYRLGNIPLFVPPGHMMMFMLGLALAQRLTDAFSFGVMVCAAIYAIAAVTLGWDPFSGLLMLVIVLAWVTLPAHRRLLASTFLLALTLELYGTWLGNWRWAPQVPGLALLTTNPPGIVGAFYCSLDALVAALVIGVGPRLYVRSA
jgi:hypothetical protein